jgi:Ca2+-binding EF-hand superfamily protein
VYQCVAKEMASLTRTGGKMSRIIFNKYDTSGDGKIDKSEFHAMCYSLGHYLDDETFEAAWCEVESDGSGQLVYEEFATFWSTDDRWSHLQLSEQEIENLTQVHSYFSYYDEENSGELDHREFEGVYNYMIQSGYQIDELENVLQEIDTSHDGTINYNEFIVWMVGVGVLKNEDIKKIAIKNHRLSVMNARNGPISFKSIVLFANQLGASLLLDDSDDASCCEALTSILSWIKDGVHIQGQVIFGTASEFNGDQYNPHVLAIAVFDASNGSLFSTLSSSVFVEGAGYGGSAMLVGKVLELITEGGYNTTDFDGIVNAAMEGTF